MPAGVSPKEYLKFMAAALLTMFAGSQIVHSYYNPLKDLNYYVEREMKSQRLRYVTASADVKQTTSPMAERMQ